mgnify:CR=1 FL=1
MMVIVAVFAPNVKFCSINFCFAYKDFLYSIRKGNLDYAFEGVELTETQKPDTENLEESEEEGAEEEEEKTVSSDKISKRHVRIVDEVDYEKPGVYPVYYHYEEEFERYTDVATEVLYVVVE